MMTKLLSLMNRRLIIAGRNSSKGLKDAILKEEGFRVQVFLCLFLTPLAYFIANSYQQLIMLLVVLFSADSGAIKYSYRNSSRSN